MAIPVPSQDQIMGQLRVVIPALGTIVSAFGIAGSDKVGTTVAALLTAVGPISYMISVVWSFIANSRASIMAAASKSVDPEKVPPPQIILPIQEKSLADSLPANVTSSSTLSSAPQNIAKGATP